MVIATKVTDAKKKIRNYRQNMYLNTNNRPNLRLVGTENTFSRINRKFSDLGKGKDLQVQMGFKT